MTVVALLETAILAYFLAMNGHQLVFLLRAYLATRRHLAADFSDELEDLFGTVHHKPITLICPVFNEAAGVVASVNSLLALRYPETQIIVVNDGSADDSLQRLIAAFRLRPSQRVVRKVLPSADLRGIYESLHVPNLVVVDKANGGKADALNCGLNLARFPLVCCIDGDSLLENDALLRVARPFMQNRDMAVCGGVIRPLNGCRVTPMGIRGIHLPASWMARFQVLEYLRAFLYGRLGLASYRMLFIVSGAFGIFRKDLLLEIGGFRTATVGEDFEAIVRLQRHLRARRRPFAIGMVPDPVCWTEVPEDAKTLRRQRNRWQRGLLETLWAHRGAFLRPRYGALGMVSLPYFLVFEAFAPLLELGGYLLFAFYAATGNLNAPFALLFLLAAFFLGLLNSLAAVLLEVHGGHRYQGLKPFLLLVATALFENLGFRQATLVWRLLGTFDFLRGKGHWGRMARRGIQDGDRSAPEGS